MPKYFQNIADSLAPLALGATLAGLVIGPLEIYNSAYTTTQPPQSVKTNSLDCSQLPGLEALLKENNGEFKNPKQERLYNQLKQHCDNTKYTHT